MLYLSAANDRLELLLEPDDGRFWLILRDCGVNPAGATHVIVTVCREPLDMEDLHAKIPSTRDDPDELPF